MNKKFLVIVLGVLFAFVLVGCVNASPDEDEDDAINTNTDQITEVFTQEEDSNISVIEGVSTVTLADYSDEFKSAELDSTYEVDSTIDLSTIDGTYNITEKGTYEFTGDATDVQIVVDTEEKVHIVLNGINVTNDSMAFIYVKSSDKAYITSAENTINNIVVTGDIAAVEDEELDGAIYSKDDIVFNGTGVINITSSKNGISGNDDVKVCDGTLNITATKHGISGNDSIRITSADITIIAGKDGLHSDNDDLDSYVYIQDGSLNITSSDQAISVCSDFTMKDGLLTINSSDEGIQAATINILGGTIDINAVEDGLNASSDVANIYINIVGGEITIYSTSDGLDSNGDLYISGGYTKIVQLGDDNSPINYDGESSVTGGILIAVGSTRMSEDTYSDIQGTIQTAISSNGDIALKDSDGNLIAAISTDIAYEMIYVTAPELVLDNTYSIVTLSVTTDITLTSLNYNDVD
ncbi:MAG: carbohydrate-binding domain-containing protein [Bacilli bacterium]